ncbi:MAG TPA: radical SAM protein [Nitrospirae bacterium]|nr:radical SAM protein [Nitrospirota bacterium]
MKPKIILINPPLHFSNNIPHSLDVSVPPLGLLYIASYINRYSPDFEAAILDVTEAGLSLEQIRKDIDDINPFVIGITSMTPQIQGAVELARFLKSDPSFDRKIFLGGPHVSADKDFINRYKNIFDHAITGEGEKTFLASVTRLLKKETIPVIQNGEVIDDLDTIPLPDRTLINRQRYNKRESVIFSRGCPYDCYYCSRPAISRKVRYRSVYNMLEEIKQVYAFCDGKISFQDDTLTMNRKRVLELCGGIKNESLKLDWECNTRIDLVDDEILGAMKKAGCSLIHFGVESGNELIRREQIHKRFTNQQIEKVFSLCNKHGIKVACYFMVGHPGETKDTLEETKNMILKSGIDIVGVSIPTPFPGSELYDIAEKKGIINKAVIDLFAEKKLGEGYVGNYPIYIPEGIEKEYLFDIMKSINRHFYLNFKTFWSRFKQDIFSLKRIRQDVTDFFSLIAQGVSSRKPYQNKK